MKYLILVPDGMADEPLEDFDGRTPLEVAHTNNMDYLVKSGFSGLVQTIPEGMHPGSDVGNMALLGYDPREGYTGRSPLEAVSLGIDLAEDEIAFRTNFVTVDDNQMIDYSAGHISTDEADKLIQALNDNIDDNSVRFHTGKSYRHIMVLKVDNLDAFQQLITVPPHDIIGKDITKFLPDGEVSEVICALMEKSKTILSDHQVNQVRVDLKENPANMIWLWGQGTSPTLQSYEDKFGLKGSIISAVDLVQGIGKVAGLNVIQVPGATGYYDTDYKAKAQYALDSLKDHDFVYVHVEAPDEAGHNGDAMAKKQAIENFDRDVVGTVLEHFKDNEDVRILVVPDHPTPVAKRTHTSDPVPFVIYGKGIEPNGGEVLSEKQASELGLKFSSGQEMISHYMKG